MNQNAPINERLAHYWGAVRETREALQKEFPDGAVHITSIANRYTGLKGDVVNEASVQHAAERVASGTHRISTDEEIKAYWADNAKRAVDIENAERKRLRRALLDPVDQPQQHARSRRETEPKS
jgi:hypothetical protein